MKRRKRKGAYFGASSLVMEQPVGRDDYLEKIAGAEPFQITVNFDTSRKCLQCKSKLNGPEDEIVCQSCTIAIVQAFLDSEDE